VDVDTEAWASVALQAHAENDFGFGNQFILAIPEINEEFDDVKRHYFVRE
jgi:hypothetical protein